MKRIYPICVPNEDVDEQEAEYSDVIEWCYGHLSHRNVLVLQEEDVYFLQHNTSVFDIINNDDNTWVEMGEDDWIISKETKKRIQKELKSYCKKISNERTKTLINSLLELLEISLRTNKNLYFLF